jgi:hypothetical protein
MPELSAFLKKNKTVKEHVFYPATKSLADERGNPLVWEIKPLSTKEDERIRESCTREVPVPGKPNLFRHKVDADKYVAKQVAASVVSPDLYSAELQDSYGARTPEDLLKEMVDDPGEWNDFVLFVQQFNGFNISLQEDIDEAKN